MVFAIATLDSIIIYDTQVRNNSQSVWAPMGFDCAASGAYCPECWLQSFSIYGLHLFAMFARSPVTRLMFLHAADASYFHA